MAFWSRLFRRKPDSAFRDIRDGVDWDAGDIAVCIADGWYPADPAGPRVGDYLTVEGVENGTTHPFRAPDGSKVLLKGNWLYFVGKRRSFISDCFRKVVEDAEPAEAEFTALIKRPVRKRERA